MPIIIVSPHIIIMGMPMPIMFIIFTHASANAFMSMPAFGIISQRMAPEGIISQDISHIIIGIIIGMPFIIPFIGIIPFIMPMPPIIGMGIMFMGIPPIMPFIGIIMGIMPFIIGIMFMGIVFIIGIWAAVITAELPFQGGRGAPRLVLR